MNKYIHHTMVLGCVFLCLGCGSGAHQTLPPSRAAIVAGPIVGSSRIDSEAGVLVVFSTSGTYFLLYRNILVAEGQWTALGYGIALAVSGPEGDTGSEEAEIKVDAKDRSKLHISGSFLSWADPVLTRIKPLVLPSK